MDISAEKDVFTKPNFRHAYGYFLKGSYMGL